MRIFAGRGQLASLSLEARALYTAFALFCLVGYGSSLWLYADGIGFSRTSILRWYRGGETSTEPAMAPTKKGPALDIPEEAPAATAELAVQKPPRQMMETFHFHLFTMPVVLLIIGHLFMLCRMNSTWKISVIALASLTTLGHLISPLLVRFGSPRFVFLLPSTGLLMAVSWIYMTLMPVYEMWRPRSPPVRRETKQLDHVHEPTPRV